MGEYLISLISVGALSGIASLVSYGKEQTRTEKFAVAVILVFSVISPLVSLVSDFEGFDFSDFEAPELEGGSSYGEAGREAFELGIKRLVASEWGIEEGKILVAAENFDFNTMTAGKIRITLLGKAAGVDYKEVEKYIEDAGLGACEVSYAIK